MSTPTVPTELSKSAHIAVLTAAFLGLVFDGFELGLMPVAAPSVTKSLLGNETVTAFSSQGAPSDRRSLVRAVYSGTDAGGCIWWDFSGELG